MLSLQLKAPQGSQINAMIQSLRDVPARVFPYAAATAATRTMKALASEVLPAEMQKAFDRPTPWTLKSLAIVPATKDSLSAAVFVKNMAGGRSVSQERFLLPGVEGGGRGEKRFERALRYAGLLDANERVMPGRQIELDPYGGIPQPLIRSVLAWAKSGGGKRTKRTKDAPASNPRGYFMFGKPGGVRGVAQRSGRIVMPVMIFTKTQPQYRPLLDFTGVAERYTVEHFQIEFDRAARDILSRSR